MKKFWLILLMVFFSLQAALAAVETYHGHGSEGEATIESVLHTHADHDHDHEANHGSSASQDLVDKNGNSPCEGDHHHCHAHSLTVLPSFSSFEFPPMSLAQKPERYKGYQSHLSGRIERPKWA